MTDRAHVSRRLKAARWLAGDVDDKGRPTPLAVADLAAREQLAHNGISSNRLEEIEQMKVDARPMELREIAAALGVGIQFFTADIVGPTGSQQELDRIETDVEDNARKLDEILSLLHADPGGVLEDELTGPDEDAPSAAAA